MSDEKPKRMRKPRNSVWHGMSAENKAKQLANLRAHQWKPGQSGNPSGFPKGTFNLDRELRKRLGDKQLKAKLVEALIEQALMGDPKSLKLIAERTGGALAPNALLAEMAEEKSESSSRTVLFNDEEEATKLQPAGQAEDDEDDE
jgi:hypothetical protein